MSTDAAAPAPDFFEVSAASIGSDLVPLAVGPGFELRDEKPCPVCSTKWQRYVGEGRYRVEGGRSWTDAISVSGYYPPFLVSQRVLDGLEGIGATGFEALPVRIEQVQSRALRVLPEPRYYYLDVGGRIDIDYQASGERDIARCPTCHTNISGKVAYPRRYMPLMGSESRPDLCKIGPAPMWGQLFCSRRVLELARRDRWTNFRFDPMDVVREQKSSWSGIDYLGRQWPPMRWYPESPSAGKNLNEWIELMRSSDAEQARTARVAIHDIGEPAIPVLTEMLMDPSIEVRRKAAKLLFSLSYHYPLPNELKKQIHPLLPPDLAPAWGSIQA